MTDDPRTEDEDVEERALQARIEADRHKAAGLKGEVDALDEEVAPTPPKIDHPNADGGVI